MALSPDRKKQVETTKARHGDDHYKKIGHKGGKNNKTNNSEKGRMAANVRWAKYRADKAKNEKGDQ